MHTHSSSTLSKDGHSFRIPAKLTLRDGHCQDGQDGQDGQYGQYGQDGQDGQDGHDGPDGQDGHDDHHLPSTPPELGQHPCSVSVQFAPHKSKLE